VTKPAIGSNGVDYDLPVRRLKSKRVAGTIGYPRG